MSLKAALIAVSVVATLAGSWGFFFLTSAPIVVDPPVRVTVKPGSTARDVIAELADKGVVRSERVMTFLARMSGVDREIRFGDHDFAGSLTPEHVLEELMRDPKPVVRITIPEGLTLYEVGELLESQEIVEANAYRKAACAPELLTALSIPTGSNCAEGYLFPDTYNLAPEMDAPAVVQLQVQRFQRVVTAIVSALEKQGVERPANRLSLHETVVLASIVEKETRVEKERPLISSVFHNRLSRGMKLQADPTVIYGLTVKGTPWDGTLLHKHLRVPGPYNTYTIEGLPPGPIANPGREALKAALAPLESDALYFVADGTGAHSFSTNLADHNRAVAKLRNR